MAKQNQLLAKQCSAICNMSGMKETLNVINMLLTKKETNVAASQTVE